MKRFLVSSGRPFEDLIVFSRAVRVGPYITVGGTAPLDSEGNTVGIGNIAIQTKQCLEIIKMALQEAGASLHDVVRTRMLLVNINDWKTVAEVRASYFKEIKPVDTIMQVSGFLKPEWLIEIEVDAIISQ